jgi:hypothetical protein
MRDPTLFAPQLAELIRLAKLADPQVGKLREALHDAPVLVSNRADFIRGVAAVDGIAPEDQEAIVWALTHLGAYTGGSEGVTQDLINSVHDYLLRQKVSKDDATRVCKLLPDLLAVDTVRIRSKAAYLRTDHARAFKHARVLTDLRPIFGLNESMTIEGAVVMHALKLEYYEDDFARDFFVTLDDVDLETLRLAVVRAQNKAKALRATVSGCITDFSREGDA